MYICICIYVEGTPCISNDYLIYIYIYIERERDTGWCHWDPFAFLPLLALAISVIVLSSGQSGLTKSKVLQILFAEDLCPPPSVC